MVDNNNVVSITSKGFTNLFPSQDGRNLIWTVDKDIEMPIFMTN